MSRSKRRPRRPQGESLNLHLGQESRRQLERCRQLLYDTDAAGSIPSAGAVVRLAVRRLLLSILAPRADLYSPTCPYAAEYHRILGEDL